MALGIGNIPRGTITPMTLGAVCNIIRPGLPQLCRDYGMREAEVFMDFTADCIQLVVVDALGKKYSHPRFVTRQEIEDRNWLPFLKARFETCSTGFAKPEFGLMASPSFTLSELEQAQEIVDSLK